MKPGTPLRNSWQANHLVSKGIRVQSCYALGNICKGPWSDYKSFPCTIGYSHMRNVDYRVYEHEEPYVMFCDYSEIEKRLEVFYITGKLPLKEIVPSGKF